MKVYNRLQVMDCYNRTAREYAEQFLNELNHKPFDLNVLIRFNETLPANSLIYDFGCGPGQTTKYIYDRKKHKIIGLDFSENTISLARQNFSEVEFIVDDMLNSQLPSNSANGILAFYAIVHFTYGEIIQALKEWQRLLKPDGVCVFSFHVGDESIAVENFLGVQGANATWHFLDIERVLEICKKTGFYVEEAIIRYPYKKHEHQSKRAYVWIKKTLTQKQ